MKLQVNFHKRIGLKPGLGIHYNHYGKVGTVFIFRLWYSALTFTFHRFKV